MNTPIQNKISVPQVTAPASLSCRVLCGRVLDLAAYLVVGASYLSGSASRQDLHDTDSERSEQNNMWDTEWERIPS